MCSEWFDGSSYALCRVCSSQDANRSVRLCEIDVLDTHVHDHLQVGRVKVIRRVEPLVLLQQRQQPAEVRC